MKTPLLLLVGLFFIGNSAAQLEPTDLGYIDISPSKAYNHFDIFKDPEECPPCFNCMLPGFECLHFANCSEYDGKCHCPPGFGGNNCQQPSKFLFCMYDKYFVIYSFIVCGGLDEPRKRYPRENGTTCDCPEGWEGINCNGMFFKNCM